MATVEISAVMMKRVEKLAKDAGKLPKEIMPFVLRDGLGAAEEHVTFINDGIADLDAGKGLSFEEFKRAIRPEKHDQAA